MTCCSSSEENRKQVGAPEFNKPFDPVKAGNCATCMAFGNINDTGPLPENTSVMASNTVVSKLTRGDFI